MMARYYRSIVVSVLVLASIPELVEASPAAEAQTTLSAPKSEGAPTIQYPPKILVWGTADSKEGADRLVSEYEAMKHDWSAYVEMSPGYPRIMESSAAVGGEPGRLIVVLGVCPEDRSAILLDAFEAFRPGVHLRDPQGEAQTVTCPRAPPQRYLPMSSVIKMGGKKLLGILFKGMIAHDYSLIMLLRGQDGKLLDRKEDSGLCDDAFLSWKYKAKQLEFSGLCVTGMGTVLGTAKVKRTYSIDGDKIAEQVESETVTEPELHD